MGEAVKAAVVPDKQTEEYVEAQVLTEGASGVDSENIGTKDKDSSAATVPFQHNK